MVIRRTLDTCECVVDLDHTTLNVIIFKKKCNVHNQTITGINNDQQLYDNIIVEENARKNIANDFLLQNGPNTIYDINSDGVRVFKKNISVSWSWDDVGTVPPNRLLTIIIHGITLTNNQLNSVRAKLNERFGISRVNIING